MDGKEDFFAERDWDDGAKDAGEGVAEKVVLTFLARTDLQEGIAEEALRFWATRLLGGHFFEVDRVHWRHGSYSGTDRLRWKRTGQQKISNDVFKPGK